MGECYPFDPIVHGYEQIDARHEALCKRCWAGQISIEEWRAEDAVLAAERRKLDELLERQKAQLRPLFELLGLPPTTPSRNGE